MIDVWVLSYGCRYEGTGIEAVFDHRPSDKECLALVPAPAAFHRRDSWLLEQDDQYMRVWHSKVYASEILVAKSFVLVGRPRHSARNTEVRDE